MVNNRNELMFDRQDCSDDPGEASGRGADSTPIEDSHRVGGSTITVLTFSPGTNRIRASTYDLYKGEWRNKPTESHVVQMFATGPSLSPSLSSLILPKEEL